MKALRAEARDCRGTLTIPQFRMLVNLTDGPLNNKSLAQLLGVSIAASSRMSEGLMKAGLIHKEAPLSGDKRSVSLSLTPEGMRRVDETKREVRVRFEERLCKLGDEDLARAHEGLECLKRFFALTSPGKSGPKLVSPAKASPRRESGKEHSPRL